MDWSASSFLSFRSLCFLIRSFISPGSAKIINDNIMHIAISLAETLSLILFIGTSKRVGKTVAAAFEVMREKRAAVKQEVRVIYDREVLVFRDLGRVKIFLNLVFMVWDHLFRSIYNIFIFIIAGEGEGCKFAVGN